jgi:hypothetical protein
VFEYSRRSQVGKTEARSGLLGHPTSTKHKNKNKHKHKHKNRTTDLNEPLNAQFDGVQMDAKVGQLI